VTNEEYLAAQLANTQFEGEHDVYANGVAEYVKKLTVGLAPTDRILELGCGDGTGLKLFRALGLSVLGLDIADHKLMRALQVGFPVVKADMHRLPLPDGACTAVLSAHTLEHALDPIAVMREARRVLVPGGAFRAILPYPDPGSMPEVHVAREILGLHPADLGKLRAAVAESGLLLQDLELHGCCRGPEAIIWATKP
jgi:ubiquinone/menaquinone biosynthesis C-methylase UbiE